MAGGSSTSERIRRSTRSRRRRIPRRRSRRRQRRDAGADRELSRSCDRSRSAAARGRRRGGRRSGSDSTRCPRADRRSGPGSGAVTAFSTSTERSRAPSNRERGAPCTRGARTEPSRPSSARSARPVVESPTPGRKTSGSGTGERRFARAGDWSTAARTDGSRAAPAGTRSRPPQLPAGRDVRRGEPGQLHLLDSRRLLTRREGGTLPCRRSARGGRAACGGDRVRSTSRSHTRLRAAAISCRDQPALLRPTHRRGTP